MTSKFIQQKGRYFFLSNSISVYTRNTTSSQGASGSVISAIKEASASPTLSPSSNPSATQYFFNNDIGKTNTKAAVNNSLNSSQTFQKKILSSQSLASLFKLNTQSSSSSQEAAAVNKMLVTPPQSLAVSRARLEALIQSPPTLLDTLKASFFPTSLRGRISSVKSTVLSDGTRTYATFRDLGFDSDDNNGGRKRWNTGGSSGGRGGRRGVLQYLSIPILFTVGVCAVNAIALPFLFKLPGGDVLQRNPSYVIYGLIAANVAVFAAWKSPRSFGRQLYRYGLLHKDAQFNKWQMIGSSFSHQEFWHLAINMFVLYQFGGPLARWVGSKDFLEMYLDSAAISSLGSIALPVLLNRFTSLIVLSNVPSLGASGAIFSLFGTFSYLVPHARLSLFFLPLPIGAWYVFLLTMGYNGLGIGFNWARTDYAGHFAGCAAGILFGYILSEKAKRQRRQQHRVTNFRVF